MAIAAPSRWCEPPQEDRNESAERMTGAQSRLLNVGARVCWRDDKGDQGTVTEKAWPGSLSNGIIGASNPSSTMIWIQCPLFPRIDRG
jgi:hypothetical protein